MSNALTVGTMSINGEYIGVTKPRALTGNWATKRFADSNGRVINKVSIHRPGFVCIVCQGLECYPPTEDDATVWG